ncbi:MAG: diacylglycerol/lipid kinase family protein, partial [bacterium]
MQEQGARFKKILVIANAKAAQASVRTLIEWDALAKRLQSIGDSVEIAMPRSLAELDDAMALGADLVIAVGGDGTIRQVVQRMNLERQTLGALPLGGGNDFAQALGMPLKW